MKKNGWVCRGGLEFHFFEGGGRVKSNILCSVKSETFFTFIFYLFWFFPFYLQTFLFSAQLEECTCHRPPQESRQDKNWKFEKNSTFFFAQSVKNKLNHVLHVTDACTVDNFQKYFVLTAFLASSSQSSLAGRFSWESNCKRDFSSFTFHHNEVVLCAITTITSTNAKTEDQNCCQGSDHQQRHHPFLR